MDGSGQLGSSGQTTALQVIFYRRSHGPSGEEGVLVSS